MGTSLEWIKKQYAEHKAFIMYGLISVIVTVIDVIVSRVSEKAFALFIDNVAIVPVVANTLGVIVGFIIQYFLTARHVYNTQSIKSFSIFLATFFVNLLLATAIIFLFRTYVFGNSEGTIAFLVSKGASIVFPFFATYFIRKRLMPKDEESK